MSAVLRSGLMIAILTALAACGGGGGGGGGVSSLSPAGSTYTAGVFQPAATFAAQCAQPRPGTDDRQGSAMSENMFLRSWTNELYLWYQEVVDRNPSGYATEQYFDLLKTTALTPSGRQRDRFHFTYSTAAWEALSQSGVEVGYGAQWIILAGAPPRQVVIAYVEPNTPASAANLARGMEVIYVDGVDVVNDGTQAGVDTLNAGFFPDQAGESHTFIVRALDDSTRTVSMTAGEVTHTPVLLHRSIDQAGVPVGYLLFNDHIATAESALVDAVSALAAANVQDLVLDIRYNGGGFLDIASELAYMIGGAMTVGQTFERMVFNDKHPTTNPVTGRALTPTPFHTTTQGFAGAAGAPLPTLNLTRVYVITGPGTCSASESIINGLRGAGIEVFQIGSTTCGKPYGFYPQDNCGTTYFSIQFQGQNALGFGDYPDGFSPQNTSGVRGVELNGCSVADDFAHQLGEPGEARLATALALRANNNSSAVCPAPSGFAPGTQFKPGQPLGAADGVMYKSPLRENRLVRRQ